MSWPNIELNELCELLTDGTRYTPINVGEGVPFLTVKDVSEKGLDFEGCAKITFEDYFKADNGNSAPKKGMSYFQKMEP